MEKLENGEKIIEQKMVKMVGVSSVWSIKMINSKKITFKSTKINKEISYTIVLNAKDKEYWYKERKMLSKDNVLNYVPFVFKKNQLMESFRLFSKFK